MEMETVLRNGSGQPSKWNVWEPYTVSDALAQRRHHRGNCAVLEVSTVHTAFLLAPLIA